MPNLTFSELSGSCVEKVKILDVRIDPEPALIYLVSTRSMQVLGSASPALTDLEISYRAALREG